MRGWLVAGLMLAAVQPAMAQQEQPQPPMGVSTNARSLNLRFELTPLPERPDCRADTGATPDFVAILNQAAAYARIEDFANARQKLDAAAPLAVKPVDRAQLAFGEMVYAGGTKDPSHLAAAWEPVLTSGCYSAETVAQARSSLDVLVWVMMQG